MEKGSAYRRSTINATSPHHLPSMSQRPRVVCLTRKEDGKEKRRARVQESPSIEQTASQEPTYVLYTEVELNIFLQSNFLGDI